MPQSATAPKTGRWSTTLNISKAMNPVDYKLEEFARYCLSSGDSSARAWVFSDGPPFPLSDGTRSFSAPDSKLSIHLVDQYHGRTPHLVNLNTLTRGPDVQIGFRPFVVLDSNVVSYVDRFFRGKLEPEPSEAVRRFVSFLFDNNVDPTPVFYYIESLSKTDRERWRGFASLFAETHLALQTLDRDLFRETGRLASSLERRETQVRFHGAEDASHLIGSYLDSISPDNARTESGSVSLSYAALLKVALMRVAGPRSLADRFNELGDYMASHLGAVLGMERFAAVLHWAAPERFAKMIPPLQKGMSATKFFGKLGSTAWDLYLGRMPEQLGRFVSPASSDGAEAVCDLYYVATGEDALAELIRHRTIELLVQHADSKASSKVVGQLSTPFEDHMSPDELADFARRTGEHDRLLMATASQRTSLSGPALDDLVSDLESQVVAACRS